MKVTLTPFLEKMVKEKVQSGLYNSSDEVISEALRQLFRRETMWSVKIEALNLEIDKGLNNYYKNMLKPLEALDEINNNE